MLSTYLTTVPYTKCVLIEDSVAAKSTKILDFLLKNHERMENYKTHFFIFEGCFNTRKRPNSVCYDFTSDCRNWIGQNDDLDKVLLSLSGQCVVVIDSVVHIIYKYGFLQTYRLLSELKSKANVQQIVAVLHSDLLQDKLKIIQCFQYLATLYMELELKRIAYIYKKSARKIVKQIEEYCFDDGKFVTKEVKKVDKDVVKAAIEQINPENISTFKIGLSEKDKESRNNLILPYLPKDNDSTIHYNFEEIDDWDEEDPDDDLDI